MSIDLQSADALFYVPDLAQLDGNGVFSAEESHHVTGSRRLREGDELHVFDGHGTVARVGITSVDPRGRSTTFEVIERLRLPPSARRVGLIAAVPKGDRQNTLLDMATQLGMTDYWPGLFERSVTRPDGVNDRWRRIVVAACKQSRRPYFPQLHDPVELSGVSTALKPAQVLYANAGGQSVQRCLEGVSGDIVVVVGPEGGFTGSECNALKNAGALCVGLGDGILRAETAAVAALAAVQSIYSPGE